MQGTFERTRPRVVARGVWPIIGLALAIKLLILLIGALSALVFYGQALGPPRRLLEIWSRWDAPHYLDLATYGYQPGGEIGLYLVFYPLYPWLTRVAAVFAGGDVLVGAFLVSAVASVVAAVLLERLAAIDEPPRIAREAVWFFLIFPTSYFLHIPYTESLFIALTLGCFLMARRERWLLAGMLGGLAALARVNGLVLIPALLVEAALQYRATRRFDWRRLAAVGGVAAGFGGYLLLNYAVTGDALRFLAIQREHWHKALEWPWNGIWTTIMSFPARPPGEAHMVVFEELIYITLSLACTILAAIKLRASYTVWMAGNWLLFTGTSFIMSVPRYVLILFPMFILFARLSRDRRWFVVLTVWSLLFMILFVTLFVGGHWAF